MKICFFSHGSGTNQDGATLSMLNIMDELASRGHQVIGIMAKDVNLNYIKGKENVKFYFIPSYDMRLDLKRKGFDVELKYFIKNRINWFIMRKTLNILKKEKIDIIHINGLNNGIGALIAKSFNIPYVWHIRQLMQEDLNQRLYNQKQVWSMVKAADGVIAISKAVKDKFEMEFNREIKVVYNGVPLGDYQVKNHEIFTNEYTRIILPGRIVEGKGQLDAVKAVQKIVKDGNRKLLLILSGHSQDQYADRLKKYVFENHLSNYIEFQEHNSDLRELRSTCDIGLTCSKKEAFGRVTVENQMAGLLAIGSDTGGTPEIIEHGKTGILYHEGDYKSLAEKIEYAVRNKVKMRQLAQNGYMNAAEKYSIIRVVDQVLEIYSLCLKNKE